MLGKRERGKKNSTKGLEKASVHNVFPFKETDAVVCVWHWSSIIIRRSGLCVNSAHWHTQRPSPTLYLFTASRANHSRELETQLMTCIKHLQDVSGKETHNMHIKACSVLWVFLQCLCAYGAACRFAPWGKNAVRLKANTSKAQQPTCLKWKWNPTAFSVRGTDAGSGQSRENV